jgi:starvation-inducible outer membrane lipoprotein
VPKFLQVVLASRVRRWRHGAMRVIWLSLGLALAGCASAPRHVIHPDDVSFSTQAPADSTRVGRFSVKVENLDILDLAKAPLALQEEAAREGGNVIVLDTDTLNIVRDVLSLPNHKTIWCEVYYSPSR